MLVLRELKLTAAKDKEKRMGALITVEKMLSQLSVAEQTLKLQHNATGRTVI